MKWFRFDFKEDKATLTYFNDRGEMKLDIGFGHNEFGLFPEDGYSDEVGAMWCSGNRYRYAASGEWCEEAKLRVRVQIGDKYFANLYILIGFTGDKAGIKIHKNAEGFLYGYEGFGTGKSE